MKFAEQCSPKLGAPIFPPYVKMLSYQAEVSKHVSGELTSLIAPQHFASNLDISFSPSKLIVARDGGSFYDTKKQKSQGFTAKTAIYIFSLYSYFSIIINLTLLFM